jgi:hypothetical protein
MKPGASPLYCYASEKLRLMVVSESLDSSMATEAAH